MVAVQPVEDLKEMCQRLEEQEVEAQVGDRYQFFEQSSSYDLPLLTAEQREGGSGPVSAAAGRPFGAATAAAGQVPNKYSISSVDS
jgi:hypothetical protein